ncbi:MAG TPA: aminodeoxychorismate synthase component I [Steroidobacteraceae bacterium]|nr:aminodeoxychorismate synthase component I [Steroidobacteraceae bacterium]
MAPTVRSFSAGFEPLDLVERFPEDYPGLLESGAATPVAAGAQYDILPFASGEHLRLDPDGVLAGPHAGKKGFLDAFEAWWRALRRIDPADAPPAHTEPFPARAESLPFRGGWLLYLGYEVAGEIESCLAMPRSPDPLVALGLRAPAAWLKDRTTGKAWLIAEAGREAMLDKFERRVAELRDSAPSQRAPVRIAEEDPAKFLAAVSRALEHTAAGNVYQTNLSRQWQAIAPCPVSATALYKRLRSTNPSPFAAILRWEDFAVLSSSPERLVKVQGGHVATRPIAGTRPRGATADEDAMLIRTLLDSEKERAEHVMLIDLERNDLGRICVGGTVQVDEFMSVETYAHVHHIVSNVSGRLRRDVSPVEVIRALFPGGTITGCPKVQTMRVIAELEGGGRGAYTGSIGYVNRDGSCDFNILIRTLTARGASINFRAGAGIVADSIPAQELAETRAKAAGLLRALESEP